MPCLQPSILTGLLEPHCLFLSTVYSVLTACSHQWNGVQHLAFSSPSLHPAAGFDVPAVHSSTLSVVQTSWQPSKAASWCEPLLPRHVPLVILTHYYSTLQLVSPPAGMHLIRCSSFDVPDVHTAFVFAATRNCVCSFISNTKTRMLSQKSLLSWSLKFFLFQLCVAWY